MSQRAISEFSQTAAGHEFFVAYDALLARWPAHRAVDVETAHGVTRANVCGHEHAPPVVLLPGGGATSTAYTHNVAALSATHRVVALDVIGDAGRSRPGSGRPRDTSELLTWLADVLDELGVGDARFVGHSYGAMIALAFALSHHRDRVGGLVLLDPSSCFTGMKPTYLLRALPVLVRPSPERQRRFLEWECRSSGVDPVDLDQDWLTVACMAAAFPTTRPVVPRRPDARALATLNGFGMTAILAPHSKIHDPTTVAQRITATVEDATVMTLASGSHHTLPLAPADDINHSLVRALNPGPTE
ncbi:alpha/beta hydrolase [Gordonia sp. ABSL49_1]|uniref:alpha/beta hydrolase n=1 Tax=Gordonia sp. ABSL49_1 TaxID=2920941 RepID=UPI001F0D749F|nr:alpha/beta hydrolase [Gordonia sp. ABSL49_1]MCH5644812.1 alpha/beta fold hydrolase [Gordonia sp. ABSL49_1]